jgi:DNA-binding beta-propeller fold protein YncE
VADPAAGRIYDNIEDQNLVVAIDVRTHTVVERWPIAPGEGGAGMALDGAHHRLFLGCRNQRMMMLDTRTGHMLASIPIGQGVDANAFDPATQLVFSSNGEGSVTIAREQGIDQLTLFQNLLTRASARTMALDPASHRIYLASGTRGVAGSVRILVYGPTAAH